jgi:hypothetical protein
MSDQDLISILPVIGRRPADLELPAATALSILLHINIRIYSMYDNDGRYNFDSLVYNAYITSPTITLLHHYYHYDYLRPNPAPD